MAGNSTRSPGKTQRPRSASPGGDGPGTRGFVTCLFAVNYRRVLGIEAHHRSDLAVYVMNLGDPTIRHRLRNTGISRGDANDGAGSTVPDFLFPRDPAPWHHTTRPGIAPPHRSPRT